MTFVVSVVRPLPPSGNVYCNVNAREMLPQCNTVVFCEFSVQPQSNCQILAGFIEMFCYRRPFVKETFCYGDLLCGDVLSRRRFVRRRFVCASYIPVPTAHTEEREGLETGSTTVGPSDSPVVGGNR